MDSLRMEDEQLDPYLLFTIKDQNGNVVRHLKTSAKKGLQKIVWDFHYNTPAPVAGRYKPGADELFGSSEDGVLAAPGQYTVALEKYEDGILSPLAGPGSFTFKLLDNSSLPTDMNANAAFGQKVINLRKAVSAANDLINNMEQRLKNIDLAAADMPANSKSIVEESYKVRAELLKQRTLLFGDNTRGRREFETEPSINDRVGGAEGVVTGNTSKVPKMYIESFAVASKQFSTLLGEMKKIHSSIEQLEKKLELNHAPYTTGRWPEWKGE
ncbi:MAG TPA: hypothetical protein DGG95_16025 [Cytophagales bacterium]|nr:hypothetical protein [Cytophagales bacterium]